MPPPRVDRRVLESWQARVVHHRCQDGLIAWEIDLPPGFSAPTHEHELPFFCALVDGEMENRYARRPLAYDRSLNVWHPAGTVHTTTVGPRGATIVTLEAGPAWMRRLDGMPPLPGVPTPVGGEDGPWLLRRLRRELQQPLPCSALVVEGLALELLAAAARGGCLEPRPCWLGRVLERLHDDLDGPLTVRALAEEVAVNPARLSATFRRQLGTSLGEYRRALQVERVRERLSDPRYADDSLAAIALDAGFADQAHCTRVFKAGTGWTPARYRARALGRAACDAHADA